MSNPTSERGAAGVLDTLEKSDSPQKFEEVITKNRTPACIGTTVVKFVLAGALVQGMVFITAQLVIGWAMFVLEYSLKVMLVEISALGYPQASVTLVNNTPGGFGGAAHK